MYEYESEPNRCYCGEDVRKHCKEEHELRTREIRCHLLQREIDVFQKHDTVLAALHV